MRRLTCLFLTLLLLLSLTACGGSVPVAQDVPAPSESEDPSATPSENVEVPAEEPEPVSEPEPAPEPEPYQIYDPTVMPEGGMRNGVVYSEYNGIVEHLFFHPVIAYPEQAFDGDHMSNGYDDWMVTVGEYNKILQSVY